MWSNARSNRPFFLTICASIVVLATVAGLLAWYSLTRPPTPPQATCGAVVFLQGRPQQPVSKDAPEVERCFYRGYQQCAAMTMEVDQHGIDTGSTTVYWPHKQENTCQILAQSSTFGLVSSANSTAVQTCLRVIPKNSGLLFQGCSSSGDVFIVG